jgi:hypothetical protein
MNRKSLGKLYFSIFLENICVCRDIKGISGKTGVHRYTDGSLSIFHGPRKLADYDEKGNLKIKKKVKAA